MCIRDRYNNNALGVQIVGAKSDSGYTEVDIGGGIEGGYAATQLYFWTAEDTTTANGTLRWKIDSSGHLLPGTAGAVNIGSATTEIGNVYLANNKRIYFGCLLYTSPSPRDRTRSRMPSSA